MTATSEVSGPVDSLLGSAGLESAEQRASGCARPVRPQGSKRLVNIETGEVQTSTAPLLSSTATRTSGATTAVPASVRPAVASTRATPGTCSCVGWPAGRAFRRRWLTGRAPSYVCARQVDVVQQASCARGPADRSAPLLGVLCLRRSRALAVARARAVEALHDRAATEPGEACGPQGHALPQACRISYSKVVEFQARGLNHVHAPIRLDGSSGPDGPPCTLPLTVIDLEAAVTSAAVAVHLDSTPLGDGTSYRLRWGTQADARTISDGAGRDSARRTKRVHPEQVAAYLTKYLRKTTEDFGLSSAVGSSVHARLLGAPPHVSSFVYVSRGYLQLDQATEAVRSTAMARAA